MEREKLGFEITELMLEAHNEDLRKAKESFFEKFDVAFNLLSKEQLGAIEFEETLHEYLDILKKSYYIAGSEVKDLIEKSKIREFRKQNRKAV